MWNSFNKIKIINKETNIIPGIYYVLLNKNDEMKIFTVYYSIK